jgi:prepilin-type N-terminal cleavage/methylation domain-containing protein
VKKHRKSGKQMRGYSIVELLVSMAIISIFSAIAVPSLFRTYRSYQMDDAASQVAAIVKFCRYEAVRVNKPLDCAIRVVNGQVAIFSDINRDGNIDPGERELLLSGNGTVVTAASVPSTAPVTNLVGAGALTTVNPTTGSLITFDGRGAQTAPAGASVYWVGNVNYGWRAVTVLPSGSIQVWSYATGTWVPLS